MKKHKRDYSSSMESARSAAGSWCSQSRPQRGFIEPLERLWNKAVYCYPRITAHFCVRYFFLYIVITVAAIVRFLILSENNIYFSAITFDRF